MLRWRDMRRGVGICADVKGCGRFVVRELRGPGPSVELRLNSTPIDLFETIDLARAEAEARSLPMLAAKAEFDEETAVMRALAGLPDLSGDAGRIFTDRDGKDC